MSEHESIRDGLHDAAEAVIDRAITIARETEKAGAWSDHDRLVALGALDHLNANIIAGRVADAILAYLAAQATEAGVAEVLRRHRPDPSATGITPGGNPVCVCGQWYVDLAEHQAAALAPLLAARAETRSRGEQVTDAAEHLPNGTYRLTVRDDGVTINTGPFVLDVDDPAVWGVETDPEVPRD